MKVQKKFVVEIPIAGEWRYYFGSNSRAMAESILAYLARAGQEARLCG